MVQLIQMRQQIRAIESIKKITHAMRLISMSNHTQLNHKAPLIENYKNELIKIIDIVQTASQNLKSDIINSNESKPKTLVILIGSQKGLAGTYNTALFRFFEKNISQENYKNFDFITIGKKASDFLRKHTNPIKSFDHFTITNLYEISNNIFEYISEIQYSNVIVYSNYPKSFFAQVPQEEIIVPTRSPETTDKSNLNLVLESYIWEQPIDDIYQTLIKEYLNLSIQSLLFNSLLAEQAARFQSMDSATRNAEELLSTLKLHYNKIRQTKITKEITELSASLR